MLSQETLITAWHDEAGMYTGGHQELANTKTDPMQRLIWTSVGIRTALTLT